MNATEAATLSQWPVAVALRPRLGFLGLGWIGTHRLAALGRAGVAEIVAIADPVDEMLVGAAQHAPGALRFADPDELFNLDLDAVVIGTPSAQHGQQCASALKRGLAVFCQKPLGRNSREVSEVIDLARSADRLLGVDLSYRYTEALQQIRQLVRQNALGEIFAVNLVFHNAYGPQKPWFYDRNQSGGGCVMDLGIHLMDAALWILDQPIVGVTSRLLHHGKRIEKLESLCEDYATARLDLANGATISLSCSWHLHAGRDAVIEASFYGTKSGAAMRNVNGSFYDFIAERFDSTSRHVLAGFPDEWFGRAAVEWARRLSTDRTFDPEIERMLEVASAIDAIYENANL
ncbi:MAG TPA: Gfo/Idh/MocA family oxidoreductase [Candidatus Udaeobacter sp.]|jgi:predicted dehydrogenase|nr:Gfo/Idh/MocA family oxidoreductase [Candidatus Udaeobacter sp.]